MLRRHREGQLDDDLTFQGLIADWFPGWAHKYGAEPSSKTPSEDCVELRQSFPGLEQVDLGNNNNILDDPTDEIKNQLYWSDQECRQENWFICSKSLKNPELALLKADANTIENCTVNIRLTREEPVQYIREKSSGHQKLTNCTYQVSAFDG